ncbi:DUF2207 domain-containing protein [Lactiplantibacillus carotarum]|uniref:DUF2207 domain-containing protein n=1 Tax=Lactiplantibacillus carotarum TaxID=2993456 RepID=UPI00298ED60E|nr:DUF2207 domain-containing protein [Lactiplantibacillus carotarum]
MQTRTYRLWLSVVGLVLFCTWLITQPLHAQADYTVDDYHVQVDVHKNGDATVMQTMRYDFDDDYHGVFNVQDLRGIQGAKLEYVFSQLNGSKIRTATASWSGANNTYQVSQNAQRMRVKFYQQLREDDALQIGYQYRLKGVVTNYADTAELNWKVIGTGWDVALHNVRITIQLPQTNVAALQAWTHGPLNGHTTVDKQKGRVTLTLKRNPANQFVESHLLFPTSVTATNARTSPKKRRGAVQKQEAALAKQANQKRQRNRLLQRLAGIAGIVVWASALLGYLWWFKRHPQNPHTKPIPLNHSFDVPPVDPAAAQALRRNGDPDTRALTAEILRAAANREIKITTEPGPTKRHPEVKLTKLKSVQNSFLAACFKTVAKDSVLDLEELRRFGKRDKKGRLSHWYRQWQRAVTAEIQPYQDQNNQDIRRYWLGAAITMTILGAVATWLAALISPTALIVMGSLALIVAGTSWIVGLVRRRQILTHTDAGLALINQINGLRRMLKDIGHFNTAEVGDLILWEALLPYATAFGLAERVTDQLAIDFGTDVLARDLGIYYPLFFTYDGSGLDFSGIINDSFSGAVSASTDASSSSGGSGGFSGGSSGGFGGGSGGGAF